MTGINGKETECQYFVLSERVPGVNMWRSW